MKRLSARVLPATDLGTVLIPMTTGLRVSRRGGRDRLDLLARGTDNRLKHRLGVRMGTLWRELMTGPTAVSRAISRINVFIHTRNNQLA